MAELTTTCLAAFQSANSAMVMLRRTTSSSLRGIGYGLMLRLVVIYCVFVDQSGCENAVSTMYAVLKRTLNFATSKCWL